VCIAAIRSAVGGVIGGLSGLIAALNDPCSDISDLINATLAGAAVGVVASNVPGSSLVGSASNVAIRQGAIGFGGNTAGQLVTSGASNYNIRQATTQGVITAVSGVLGNQAGLSQAVITARSGASGTTALRAGESVGGAMAALANTSVNLPLPGNYGGMSPPTNSNCECR